MDRRRALSPGYLAVGRSEVERFVGENVCVGNWVRKFRCSVSDERVGNLDGLSGGRLNKARMLCRFFKWLRLAKKIDLKPLSLLNRQLELRQSSNIEDRRWLVNLVLEHSQYNPDFKDYSDCRKYDIFQSVKSFCDFHEVPLTTAKNIFGRKRKKKNHRKQITPSEAKDLLGKMCQRDRTISLIQWQSGMELGAVLNKFGYEWRSQVKPQLDADCERLKVEFDERKGNGTYYFTYVSHDGIHELRKWLIERQRIIEDLVGKGQKISKAIIEGEPIFITNRGTALQEGMYAHELKRKTDGKVTSHMFRKLFESEAKVPSRGIDKEYVMFWMGHVPKQDDAGGIYDRNIEFREEIFENEYAKLEPYINIYSGVQPQVNDESEGLRRELAEVKRDLSWVKELLADPEVSAYMKQAKTK